MALTFNHSAKQISVPQLDAQPLLIQDLVNAIREEEASERGIAYDQILDASGKETLKSGVTTGITAALRSTWAISFEAGAYQATIDGGNLADALNRVVNTGSPQVLVLASAAATITTADGGALAPTAEQNATAVWTRILEGTLTAEQLQRVLLAALAGKRDGIGTSTETYYGQDGTTPRITLTPDANGNGTPTVNGS